jgi:hypothetical protein
MCQRENNSTRHHRYGLSEPKTHTLDLMMTGNLLPGLMSLVPNCIEQMDVPGHGDNLLDPWTLHASRGLFKLLEAL